MSRPKREKPDRRLHIDIPQKSRRAYLVLGLLCTSNQGCIVLQTDKKNPKALLPANVFIYFVYRPTYFLKHGSLRCTKKCPG